MINITSMMNSVLRIESISKNIFLFRRPSEMRRASELLALGLGVAGGFSIYVFASKKKEELYDLRKFIERGSLNF